VRAREAARVVVLTACAIVARIGPAKAQRRGTNARRGSPVRPAAALAVARQWALTDALQRSHAVDRCWRAYQRIDDEAPTVHLRVRVVVARSGAVTAVSVMEAAPPRLVECVRREIRTIAMPAGDAATIEVMFVLDA